MVDGEIEEMRHLGSMFQSKLGDDKPNPNYVKESLRESIEKELMAINKEAEHEIIASKLEKVQALIDKKQSQISRLDEDEDIKDLTDAKKLKKFQKTLNR
jgi:hypothetical protein